MGVSIWYAGVQVDPAQRAAAVEFAGEFARAMEWGVQTVSLTQKRAHLGSQILECPKVEGLALLPHFACEPVSLIFLDEPGILVDWYVKDEGDQEVRLTAEPFVKTQFGGVGAHAEVCDFLAEIKKRFVPNLQVDDESEFFAHRDPAKLKLAFDAAWATIARIAIEARAGGELEFDIGGIRIRPQDPASHDEFGTLDPEQRDLLLQAEQWLMTRYGGFGYTFDRSLESITDLDLLMSEADSENMIERLEDPEVEAFVQSAGTYFGRTLAALLGGSWSVEEDEGLQLRSVGGVGIQTNPFQVAADRLTRGPAFSFTHHFGLFSELSKHFRQAGG